MTIPASSNDVLNGAAANPVSPPVGTIEEVSTDLHCSGEIPREVLDRDYRELCRRVGALLLMAMGDQDASFEHLDEVLQKRIGTTRRWFNRFIDGKLDDFRIASDMARAMDRRMRFEFGDARPRRGPEVTLPKQDSIKAGR